MVSGLTFSVLRTMSIANAFVIYFTIGVPFGVLSIYFTNSRINVIKAAWFAAHLVLWPVFAVRSLARLLFEVSSLPSPSNKFVIRNDLRSRFEAIIPDTVEPFHRRELIFEIERFIALADAAADARENVVPTALAIHGDIEHPQADIASKCRRRRLLTQLSRHQLDAFFCIYDLAEEHDIQIPNVISSELQRMTDLPSPAETASNAERIAA